MVMTSLLEHSDALPKECSRYLSKKLIPVNIVLNNLRSNFKFHYHLVVKVNFSQVTSKLNQKSV